MSDQPKLCLHCAHYDQETPEWMPAYCNAPQVDLVTGEPLKLIPYCYEMRRFDGRCGPDAKLYVARESTSPVREGE